MPNRLGPRVKAPQWNTSASMQHSSCIPVRSCRHEGTGHSESGFARRLCLTATDADHRWIFCIFNPDVLRCIQLLVYRDRSVRLLSWFELRGRWVTLSWRHDMPVGSCCYIAVGFPNGTTMRLFWNSCILLVVHQATILLLEAYDGMLEQKISALMISNQTSFSEAQPAYGWFQLGPHHFNLRSLTLHLSPSYRVQVTKCVLGLSYKRFHHKFMLLSHRTCKSCPLPPSPRIMLIACSSVFLLWKNFAF